MRYKELLEKLQTLSDEQLEDDVAVFDAREEEYFYVSYIEQETDNDVLDKDSIYLVFSS
jgi:hypothetical protein